MPLKKCGAISPAAAVVMSAGSVFNNMLGNMQQREAQDYAIGAQSFENQLNRDWQTIEAEKARQYNTSERLSAQNWNKYMTDFQNAYSAPSAQASRLRAAGLNPVIAMGSTGTTSVSAGSAPSSPQSSPVPSPVGGLSALGVQPVDLQIPQLVNSIASMISSTATAKKANVETSYLESGIPDMLRSLKTDADIRDVAKQMQGIDLELKKMTFKPAVKKAISEAEKVTWDAMISKLTTGKVKDEQAVLRSQKSLNDALATLNSNQGKLFALDVVNYYRKLNSVLGLQSAQASQARASASESTANAALLASEKTLKDIAYNWENKSFDVRLESELSNLKSKKAISDSQYEDAMLQLERINKIKSSYDGSERLKKVDAALEHLFRLIGLNVSASVHN